MEKLEPKNGVGWNVLNSTKAVLQQILLQQQDGGINTHAEETVFSLKVVQITSDVKG